MPVPTNPAPKKEKGRKRKLTWCGREVVNSAEVREKNRLAQARSRKRRKIQKQLETKELFSLREKNATLTSSVNLLTEQCQAHVQEKERLFSEIDALRAERDRLRDQLEGPSQKDKSLLETSPVCRSAASVASPQRTQERFSMMVCLILMTYYQIFSTFSRQKSRIGTLDFPTMYHRPRNNLPTHSLTSRAKISLSSQISRQCFGIQKLEYDESYANPPG